MLLQDTRNNVISLIAVLSWSCFLSVTVDCGLCRHMFKPVDDHTLAQIIDRIEQEKLHLEQLSALSTVSAVSADESSRSLGDESRRPQPMSVDEPVVVTADIHQPMEQPGLLLS